MYKDDFFSPFPPPLPSFNHYEESGQSKLMAEMHVPAILKHPCGQPGVSPAADSGPRRRLCLTLGQVMGMQTKDGLGVKSHGFDAASWTT